MTEGSLEKRIRAIIDSPEWDGLQKVVRIKALLDGERETATRIREGAEWVPYPSEAELFDVLYVGSIQRFRKSGLVYAWALGQRLGGYRDAETAREAVLSEVAEAAVTRRQTAMEEEHKRVRRLRPTLFIDLAAAPSNAHEILRDMGVQFMTSWVDKHGINVLEGCSGIPSILPVWVTQKHPIDPNGTHQR